MELLIFITVLLSAMVIGEYFILLEISKLKK
jgi:hypothetical protein